MHYKSAVLLLTISLAFCMQIAAAQAATTVSVSPSHTNVNLGNKFYANVSINTNDNVWAMTFELSYDKNRITSWRTAEGSFLKQGGAGTYVVGNTTDNNNGKITYAITRMGGQFGGANGQGTIATIYFDSVAAGTSALDLGAVTILDNNLLNISNNNVLNISIAVNDGDVRVNRLPSASSLQITPASPKTDDSLVGSYSYSDPDSDPQGTSEIRWYRNSALQPAYNNQTTVPASATTKGDVWYFTVRPSDGYGLGTRQNSTSVTIQNTVPVASSLQLTPALPKTDDNLVASYSYSDADSDAQSGSEIRWYKNNTLQTAYNNLLTVPASATTKGENWYYTVKPRDGTDFGTLQTSSTVTIQNTVPVASSLVLSPANPKTDDNLVASYSYSDADSDAQSGSEIRWYKGGVLQSAYNNLLTVPASATTKNDVWYFTVRPSDGYGLGTRQNSSSVTIQNTAPVINMYKPLSLTPKTREGNSLQFKHTSSDADLDGLTYSWKLDSVEKATTANWTYSPAAPADLGARTILLTVSDGFATDTETWTVTVKLRGDVDGDKDVDIFDLAAAGLAYGSSTGGAYWNANADMNPSPGVDGTPEGDGTINIMDLAVVGVNWGRRY